MGRGRDFAGDSHFVWEIYLFHLVQMESCVGACPQYARGMKIQARRKHTRVKSNKHTELTYSSEDVFCEGPSSAQHRPRDLMSTLTQKGWEARSSLWRQNCPFPLTLTDSMFDIRRDWNPSGLLSVSSGVLSTKAYSAKKPYANGSHYWVIWWNRMPWQHYGLVQYNIN